MRHPKAIADLPKNKKIPVRRGSILAFVDLFREMSGKDNTAVKVKGKVFILMFLCLVSENAKANI